MRASDHLRGLARRIVAAARLVVPLRAALLTGSAARGDADFYSDIDLLLYVDELPREGTLEAIQSYIGGTNPIGREPTAHNCWLEFELDGVRTELSFTTVAWAESRLEELLTQVEEFDSRSQMILSGVLEGVPLEGEELIERWQARLREYPEPLRRAVIERRWDFVPLWYLEQAIAARDAELFRLESLLDAAFNLLAVLAALNRLYFARFELTHMRALVARMTLAPPNLADRLETLFALPSGAAAKGAGTARGRDARARGARTARSGPAAPLPAGLAAGAVEHLAKALTPCITR